MNRTETKVPKLLIEDNPPKSISKKIESYAFRLSAYPLIYLLLLYIFIIIKCYLGEVLGATGSNNNPITST